MLSKLESIFGAISNLVIYIFLSVFNPGHKFSEVKEQKLHYKVPLNTGKDISTIKNVEIVSQIASLYFQEEVKRGQAIDEKNKILLTVATLLLAAIAVLAPHIEQRYFILLPLLPIMISVYLILAHFGVQSVNKPDWDMILSFEQDDNAKQKLSLEYLKCADYMEPKNAFRVGVYRASLRAMNIGLIMLIGLFIYWSLSPSNNMKLIGDIKNDHSLQKLLRSELGNKGDKGDSDCIDCDEFP